MPIWKVSHTDGTYQVADADDGLYPLTMGGQPVTEFVPGWSARGLQTGLPPFHVLELLHEGGDSTIWLLDETLDYRANAVPSLPERELALYMAEIEPVIRTIHTECVLAPHAAIPAVTHRFDGMLPRSIELLLSDPLARTLPAPDLVVVDRLEELQAGYGPSLTRDWIARAFESSDADAQERFSISGRDCFRHLDPATNTVFYLTRTADPAETALFVPSANVVFVRSRLTHQPLLDLVLYYAGNTQRAVSLPEADLLAPEMMVPPQHGLDEPPLHATDEAPEPAHTVFEAPLSEREPDPVPHADAAFDHAVHAEQAPVSEEPIRTGIRPPSPAPSAPPPKQNWWQRLLGLGHS